MNSVKGGVSPVVRLKLVSIAIIVLAEVFISFVHFVAFGEII